MTRWIGHAAWNGLHLADFVMPWFLVIVGFSLALSTESARVRKASKSALAKKACIRAAKLFALGLIVQGGENQQWFPAYDLASLRFMGVLQRIAICFLVVSLTLILIEPTEPTVYLCCLTT